MFVAGKLVWYLPLAFLAITALLFTFTGLAYDRHIFVQHGNSDVEGSTNFLSKETIAALKDDARLHHALLGLTESIAQTSSDLGQRFGMEGVKGFGTALTESITELRKRQAIEGQKSRLLNDANAAVGRLLGGGGSDITGEINVILGNLSNSLVEGLATPALFIGIGVGYAILIYVLTLLMSVVSACLPV